MQRTMRLCAFALAFAAFAALSGCNNQTPPAPSGPGNPPGGTTTSGNGGTSSGGGAKYVIGMSQCNLGEPWRVQMNKDITDAAAKHPEITLITRDASNNTETQQNQMREFVQQKVNLIIISPKEAIPLTAPVEEAMDANIPVIVLDRKIEGDKYTCFIGGDNVKIGREAGKYMVKLLGGKGDIVELQGLATSTPAKERHDGFMEGIKGSNIKIIYAQDCQWLEPNALKEMTSALSRFPKIDAVYGHNDPSAHGAYNAAQQEGKGREKTIKFIGIDALPTEGVKYVKDGILTATFQYPTGGEEAIDTALKILKKEPFEKNVTLGTKIFTKDTVDKGGEAL